MNLKAFVNWAVGVFSWAIFAAWVFFHQHITSFSGIMLNAYVVLCSANHARPPFIVMYISGLSWPKLSCQMYELCHEHDDLWWYICHIHPWYISHYLRNTRYISHTSMMSYILSFVKLAFEMLCSGNNIHHSFLYTHDIYIVLMGKCKVIWYDMIWYDMISYHTIPYHTMSCHVMSCHVIYMIYDIWYDIWYVIHMIYISHTFMI